MRERNEILEPIKFQEASESNIYNQQRKLLLIAVDDYLSWRNKNIFEDQYHPVAIFTWLSHYIAFEETRANNFKNALSSVYTLNPIELLQNHFKKNSKISDHSLDVCLLESLLKNKHLFLIPPQPNSLNVASLHTEVRKIIMEQKIQTPTEYAYLVAKSYHDDNSIDNHLQKACVYYTIAIEHDHEASCNELTLLAIAGNSEAQYILGFHYYHRRGDFNKAINWCMYAAEQQHPKAIDYLFKTEFSVKNYLMIAKKYDQGDGFKQDMRSAITFYGKACALNSKDAAFRLGQLCQECDKNDRKAFYYYLIVAQQKDKIALEIMIKIAERSNDDNLWFKLAQLYIDVFGDHLLALAYFKKLADRQFKDAINQLNILSKSNPEYAYVIAKLYQDDPGVKNNLQKACVYYTIAIEHDHEASCNELTLLAIAGNSEAQYILGFHYYHRRGDFNKAINWCMYAAEQQHPKAIDYLFKTEFSVKNYLMIAKKYDQGDGFKQDMRSAITFYGKACALNSKDAAFRLGQLCQECNKNDCKAFYYYLIAAKQKDKIALEIMIKIAERSNDDNLWFKLAQLYIDVFGDHLLALAYFKKLADRQFKDAINQLNILSRSNPEYAYVIAKLYEDDHSVNHHLEKACVYYSLKVQGELNVSIKESTKKRLNNILNSEQITTKELTNIGKMYYEGSDGIKKDYIMARQCFEKSCEKGCELAYYNLALMYQHAHGVEKNLITAIRYYQLADNKGCVLAKKTMDDFLNSNEVKPNELSIIASMYYSGSNGIPKNYSRAFMFYQRASHLGDKLAALHLAQLYQIEHDGIQKNIKLAFQFYLQAVKIGNHEALIPLERLGDELNAEDQLALSQLYGSFFKNKEKENYWQIKAMEVTQFKTKIK